MARWEFKLPDIGEGVTEGEIVAWCDGIVVGAQIKADQALTEVMTDKATVTITCPKGGTILELGGEVGQVVKVGENLVVLELADGATQPAAPATPSPKAAPTPAARPDPTAGAAATAVGDIREDLPGTSRAIAPKPAAPAPPAAAQRDYFADKPLATPATRKLARDLGVDLRTVPPTGPNNRVTREDVSRAAAPAATSPQPAPAAAETTAPAATTTAATTSTARAGFAPQRIASPTPAQQQLEERTPLKGVRKKIFDQMDRSVHTAAHFTFVEECDVTALKGLRARLRPEAERQGVKLTFLPFIVKAVVAALKKHPSLNSAYDETTNEIVQRSYYNIGIASSTEAGLIVPVVKDADRRSILDVAREIQRLSDATKAGKVKIEDLQGSTFTVSSLGTQGGLFATPILNFPEVGILGVHQIKQKPVVRDNQIVIGEVMLLSLSFDHRLIDGHIGAAFAYEVIGYLQDPDRLFLEMALAMLSSRSAGPGGGVATVVAPDEAGLRRAADMLRAGELVAFPTETVYGLGGLALDARAVARIFEAKGRPSTNPVIVHVTDIEQARALTPAMPALAERLAAMLWPGPLTLVIPRGSIVPDVVAASGATVAVRCPAHPVARALIEAVGAPLAAPSANRSTEVSPTRAEHVLASLGDKISLIVDGGPCEAGIESTVVDATGEVPVVLRPGTITRAQLAAALGLDRVDALDKSVARAGPARSPGLMTRHYAPRARVSLVPSETFATAIADETARGARVVALGCGTVVPSGITLPRDPSAYARGLYDALHELDVRGEVILIELPPSSSEWEAIRDRLARASASE